jgi:hypothetical protein
MSDTGSCGSDPSEPALRWLGLAGGEYRPIERSGLIDLCSNQLVSRRSRCRTTERTKEVAVNGGKRIEKGEHRETYEFENVPYRSPFTQAGGHPWRLTTTIQFTSQEVKQGFGTIAVEPTRDVKDVVTDLPGGLLGDPQAVPRCPLRQLQKFVGSCPASTQVGFAGLGTRPAKSSPALAIGALIVRVAVIALFTGTVVKLAAEAWEGKPGRLPPLARLDTALA